MNWSLHWFIDTNPVRQPDRKSLKEQEAARSEVLGIAVEWQHDRHDDNFTQKGNFCPLLAGGTPKIPTATPAGGPAPAPRPRAWLRGEGGVVQPAGVQEGPGPGPGSCRSQ
ncbi:unnamed protein product [Gadus morhua 'NCC']